MAQHDMNIANQGFPATRADLNNALQALVSNSSGTSAPSTTFANQWWYDTTNNKLYIRNEANNAWIEVAVLDQTNNEWQITTGVIQAKDGDGLALKTDDGTTRLFIKDSDGSIGIGTASPTAQLHIIGSDTTDQVIIENNDASNSSAPDLVLYRNSSSPADNDAVARIDFQGKNDAGEALDYGVILQRITDASDGTEDGKMSFYVASGGEVAGATDTETLTLESPEKVIINTSADTSDNTALQITGGTSGFSSVQFADTSDTNVGMIQYSHTSNFMQFTTNDSERCRINTDGDFFVGTTNGNPTGNHEPGTLIANYGQINIHRDAGNPLRLGRSDTGSIAALFRQGAQVGRLGVTGAGTYYGDSDVGLFFDGALDAVAPFDTNTPDFRDNAIDLGTSSARFDDVRATNGTIQTSDENEKEQIASLTSAEITAAKAIGKLFKTYKWKDKVAAKGDAARTHTGMIAQQVQSAMSDAGLDATKYAFYCSDTWYEKGVEVAAIEANDDEGIEAREAYTRTDIYKTAEEAPEGSTQKTRLSLRYPELLSFIGAATEQRLTSIEARLDALEG